MRDTFFSIIALFCIGAFFCSTLFVFTALGAESNEALVATVSINPITIKVRAPRAVREGSFFRVRMSAKNEGEYTLYDAKAHIMLPQGLRLVNSSQTKELGAIPSGRRRVASWIGSATEEGTYVVLVTVSGTLDEQTILQQKSILIRVKKNTVWAARLDRFFSGISRWFR